MTALLMIVSSPVLEKAQVVWTSRVFWGIGITGFFSLALAFSVQAWAQQYTPPTHAALIFSLEPVFAWITSFVLLGERLGIRPRRGSPLHPGRGADFRGKGQRGVNGGRADHAGVPAGIEENV